MVRLTNDDDDELMVRTEIQAVPKVPSHFFGEHCRWPPRSPDLRACDFFLSALVH